MGLQKKDKKMYLRISDGKIRLKSTKDDKEAEERYTQVDGKFHYERVFTNCEGYIRALNVQTHEEYGTTYNLELFDPSDGTTYSLGMGEESRYFQSLAFMLPNIDLSTPVVVTPYSFKVEGRSNIGVSFKQNGQKISNYYRRVINAKSDPPETEPCNGLENFTFETGMDKSDMKIEKLKLLKFLKGEIKKQIIRINEHVEKHPVSEFAESSQPDVENDAENKQPEKEQKTTAKNKRSKQSASKSKKGAKKNVEDNDDLPY